MYVILVKMYGVAFSVRMYCTKSKKIIRLHQEFSKLGCGGLQSRIVVLKGMSKRYFLYRAWVEAGRKIVIYVIPLSLVRQ
jgi:hypothetical protein